MEEKLLKLMWDNKEDCLIDCWGKIFRESTIDGFYVSENDIMFCIETNKFKTFKEFSDEVNSIIKEIDHSAYRSAYYSGMRW